MEVKTAELKAKLSRYLRSVREDGATYVVLDRKTPIARLVPLEQAQSATRDKGWLDACRRLEKRGIKITPAPSATADGWLPQPTVAPDGRTDIHTVEEMRQERDY